MYTFNILNWLNKTGKAKIENIEYKTLIYRWMFTCISIFDLKDIKVKTDSSAYIYIAYLNL